MFPPVSPFGDDPATMNSRQRLFNEEELVNDDNLYSSGETHAFKYIGTS